MADMTFINIIIKNEKTNAQKLNVTMTITKVLMLLENMTPF